MRAHALRIYMCARIYMRMRRALKFNVSIMRRRLVCITRADCLIAAQILPAPQYEYIIIRYYARIKDYGPIYY